VAVGFWQDKNKQMITCTVILAVVIFLLLHNAKAQNEIIFTQNTTFDISTQESKISFGVNGTYTSATLTNGTWIFTNLKLNGSQALSTFSVSARNSNITINSIILRNATSRLARLRYVAEGIGEQTFQMGITAGSGRGGLHPEWSVIANDVWLGEGDGWAITPDGTVTIRGVAGNISILYYNFIGLSETDKDLSFYEQHSVSITTIAFACSIVILGTVVRLKTKRHDNEMALPKTKDI
jgi:hypothetical protein